MCVYEGICVSAADFRHLADRSTSHPDALFRAAITAFVSMARPSRADANRLYDLAEPLLSLVSPEAQRFAAAALSDSASAPAALIRMIASLPATISAPLLVRSPLLGEIDLIGLISRCGLHHARAISRRKELGPRITALLASLRDEDVSRRFRDSGSGTVDDMRERLRAIGTQGGPVVPAAWKSLRDTALTGTPSLFQTALADALEIGFAEAGRIVERRSLLTAALSAVGLSAEQALLIDCAMHPRSIDATSIRQFLADYDDIDRQSIHRWLSEAETSSDRATTDPGPAANSDAGHLRQVLRAS